MGMFRYAVRRGASASLRQFRVPARRVPFRARMPRKPSSRCNRACPRRSFSRRDATAPRQTEKWRTQMRYDFSSVDETESYITVPPGLYSCKITEVRPGFARDGSERWTFRLEVLDGEYAGRMAAWDSLTWSDRGVLRVKMVLRAFGFDVSGELDIAPGDLYDVRVIAPSITSARTA